MAAAGHNRLQHLLREGNYARKRRSSTLLEAAGWDFVAGMLLGVPKSQNFDFFHEAGDDEPYTGSCCCFRPGNGFLVPATVTHIHSGCLRSDSSSRLVMGERGGVGVFVCSGISFVRTLSLQIHRSEQHQECNQQDPEGAHRRPQSGNQGTPGTNGVWS